MNLWSGYVGLPFRRLGRGPNFYDCWGLARLVLGEQRNIWLPVYDTVDPADGPSVASAIGLGKATWAQVPAAEMRELDFIVMRTAFRSGGQMISAPVHIGVAAAARRVLHVQEGGTSVLQPFNTLRHRVVEILRHKELA